MRSTLPSDAPDMGDPDDDDDYEDEDDEGDDPDDHEDEEEEGTWRVTAPRLPSGRRPPRELA